jgi:hypothetical protein
MSEVKRYDSYGYDGMSGIMKEHPEGEWVRVENYELAILECIAAGIRMQDKLAAALAECERLRGLLTDARDTYRDAIHWEDLHPVMKRIDSALSAKP